MVVVREWKRKRRARRMRAEREARAAILVKRIGILG